MNRAFIRSFVVVFALVTSCSWAANSPLPIAANPDTATAVQGVPIAINVLANDTGTGLSVVAVSQPSHGTAYLSTTTKGVTYVSAPTFVGTDTFTYTIVSTDLTAGINTTATGTVTVTVVAQNVLPPVANPDGLTVLKNSPAVGVNVLANDVGTGLTITAVTQGINGGTVTLLTAAGALNGATGVTYKPATDYVGPDRFTYTITDSRGATATGNVEVAVKAPTPPPPPVANPDSLTVLKNSPAVGVNVLGNDVGTGLSITAVTQGINGGTVALLSTAGAVNGAAGVTYKPATDYVGPDRFTYTIQDSNGATATANVEVIVFAPPPPPAPIANSDHATVAKNSTANPINVLANDVGTGLTISAVTQGVNGGTVAIVTTNSANFPVVTYTPATDYVGPDSFTYTIKDSNNATATGKVEVTVFAPTPPPPPVANPDTATVAKNSSKNFINVLLNDVGTGLTITAVTQGPNGGTVTLATSTPNGAVAGGVLYTPATDYTGPDHFTYTIKDSNNATATGNVEVVVVAPNPPPPPVANPDHATVAKNNPGTFINVLANDVGTGLNISAVTQGANGGTVTIVLTPGANLGGGPGIIYKPATDYVGPDHFTYTIKDSNNATATGNVDVEVVAPNPPPPPIANPDFAKVAKNSSSNPINVLANDVGTGLSVTAVTQGTNGGTVTLILTIVPNPGNVPQVAYTPPANYTGSDHFTYTITDSAGATATGNVEISVVAPNPPPPPIANPDSAVVAKNSVNNPINVLANDVGIGLTVTAFTQGTNGGTVAFSPSAAPNAAALIYTPLANYTGPDHFTYTITDANGATATGNVEVLVLQPDPPPPPIANPDFATVAKDSSNNVIKVLGNDVGTGLTITAVTQGTNGGTVTIVSATAGNVAGVSYTPAAGFTGTDHFTYTITDSRGTSATGNVEVLVKAPSPPPAPIANPDVATVAKNSTNNPINVLANDIGIGLTVTAVTQGTNGGTVTILTTVANPVNGANPVNISAVTYTPATDYVGPDHFTYTITDSAGVSAAGNVEVAVVGPKPPPAPIANPDTAKVLKNSANNPINVLANDVGTGLSITAVTQGTNGGTVSLAPTANPGNFSPVLYSPPTDYVGPDHFTYTITDASGATATGSVEVLVVAPTPPPPPLPPLANPDFAKVLKNSPPNPINVLLNDVGTGLTISAVTQGAHGTVAIVAPVANAGAIGGLVTYTPALDYSGPDEFIYTITDTNSATAVGHVSVYVADTTPGPIANPDFATTAKNGIGVDIDVLANDVGTTLTITAFTQPKNGTVTASAAGNGLTYVPAANFTGMDNFTYTIADANNATATGNVSVLVVAPKPVRVACTASPSTIAPGGTVAFFVQVSDVNSATVLSFSWDFGDGSTSTLRNPTHSYAAAGVYTATVNVSSGNTAIGSASVMIKVQGGTGAPTAIFTASAGIAIVGSPIKFDGSASTDPANAIASYAWDFGDGSPAGNTAIVTHTYTAPGAFTVSLTVTNAQGQTGSVSHTIQVLATPASPKLAFHSRVHYVAKLNLATPGTDTLAFSAALNVGNTVVASGTTVGVAIAGQSFAGTLDSKLQDTSTPNERWQVRTIPGQTGNLLLTLSVKKASLAAAFTTAGAVPGANANTPVTVNIPVTISVGGQDVPLMISTSFIFARGGKATAIGDGP